MLEDFGEVRELEEEDGDGGNSGGILGGLWGGKRERKGSAGSEGERTLVGSGRVKGGWRSVFSM